MEELFFLKIKFKKKKYFNEMKNFKICSFKLFEIQNISDNCFFYKIGIKSFRKIITQRNLNNALSYYKKKNRKKLNYININLFKYFKFIKTTGAHVSDGVLLTYNYKINKKIIKNHEIYSVLRKFLNV